MANNQNDPQKYLEYELIMIRGKETKHLTERGSVSIDARTAEIMNRQTETTKIFYELADEKPVIDRSALFAEAKDLGLEVPKNIKTDLLIKKINEAKE